MNKAGLVVDDSLTVRMSLVEMLEAADFPVVACATGAEARKALGERRFALAILDILLPDTDGVELLREIRANPSTAGAKSLSPPSPLVGPSRSSTPCTS